MVEWFDTNLTHIGAASTVVAALILFLYHRWPDSRGPRIALFCALPGLLFVAGAMMAKTIIGVGPNKPLLDRIFEDVTMTAVCVGSFGFLLFQVRAVDRAAYGLLEVASALLIAGYVAWSADEGPLARTLALLAATYIVVRGLDNVQVGFSEGTKTAEVYRSWHRRAAIRKSRNSHGAGTPTSRKASTDQSNNPSGPAAS